MRTWSELNPKAELRNWRIHCQLRTAHGVFYNSPSCDDGTPGQIINIVNVTDYKDHKIVLTESGEYFILYKKYMKLNGD